jgi:hypothetical protein
MAMRPKSSESIACNVGPVFALLGHVRAMPLGMLLLAALLTTGSAREAAAFKQSVHRSITKESCVATGLPRDFCSRVAVEAYNTDASEWDNLIAHSQSLTVETLCDAGNRVQVRMRGLGQQFRGNLDLLVAGQLDQADIVGTIGELVGRAAHTLQDSYAHHGMGNPEHAWFTIQDICQGTSNAPDLRPGAKEQARTATDAFLAGVAAAIRQAGIEGPLDRYSCPEADTDNDPNARGVCDSMYGATPVEVCDFLAEAEDWDGVDRQWDNAIVGPTLVAAFGAHVLYNLCQEPTLESPPAPKVDVSGGTPSCGVVHIMCLGKADDGTTPDQASAPQGGSGCSVAVGSRGDALLAGLALLGLLLAARRVARRPR